MSLQSYTNNHCANELHCSKRSCCGDLVAVAVVVVTIIVVVAVVVGHVVLVLWTQVKLTHWWCIQVVLNERHVVLIQDELKHVSLSGGDVHKPFWWHVTHDVLLFEITYPNDIMITCSRKNKKSNSKSNIIQSFYTLTIIVLIRNHGLKLSKFLYLWKLNHTENKYCSFRYFVNFLDLWKKKFCCLTLPRLKLYKLLTALFKTVGFSIHDYRL